MLNCFEATRLMSDSRERPLRFKERIALKLHTSMCKGCRNFGHQVSALSQVSKQYVKRGDGPGDNGS